MAIKKYWYGSHGPNQYDDEELMPGEGPGGYLQMAFRTDGQGFVEGPPVEDYNVIRKVDFDDAILGPSSLVTDHAIARWDGTDGRLLQNSGVLIDDSNNMSGILNLSADYIKLSSLSDGYIPYHVSDAAGLANGPIYTNGTNVSIGNTDVGYLLDVGTNASGIVAEFTGGAGGANIILLKRNDGTNIVYGIGSPSGRFSIQDVTNSVNLFGLVRQNPGSLGVTIPNVIAGADLGANAVAGTPGIFRAINAGSTGTDTVGGDLYLGSGLGRGNGTQASIYFVTPDKVGAGTSQQTYTVKMKLSGAGELSLGASSDVVLGRLAADTLYLRRTTNAQTLQIYGTYTNASNYVRLSLGATSTVCNILAETAGTGADNVDINITPAGTGSVVCGKITDSALTAGRITFAGTAGLLLDSATFLFDTATNNMFVGDTANAKMTGGGLTLKQTDATEILALKNSTISHPFTTVTETDTIGNMTMVGATGGMSFRGFTSGDAAACRFSGYIGHASPTKAAVRFQGFKTDGSTGTATIGDTELLLEIWNTTTEKVAVLGNGTIRTVGGVHVGGTSDPGADNLLVDGTGTITGAFGCNGATAQTAYASGGAVTTTAGAFGFGSDAERIALTTLVNNMRAALVANGIMS